MWWVKKRKQLLKIDIVYYIIFFFLLDIFYVLLSCPPSIPCLIEHFGTRKWLVWKVYSMVNRNDFQLVKAFFLKITTVETPLFGAWHSVMVSKLDLETCKSEFDSHRVRHWFGLVPHLSKTLRKLLLSSYIKSEALHFPRSNFAPILNKLYSITLSIYLGR